MTEEERYNAILDIIELSIILERKINNLFKIYKKFDFQEEICIKSLNKGVDGLAESIEAALKNLRVDNSYQNASEAPH